MDRDGLVGRLGSVGLTKNEALAWLTLLEDDGEEGLTGYEVSARSGVPRSAVYTVLRRLEATGAAFSAGEDPVRFLAISPDTWLENTRRATIVNLEGIRQELSTLPKRRRPEPIWIMRTYDEILDRVREMVGAAESSLYLSLWPREVEALRPELERVRDLHAVLHVHAPLSFTLQGFEVWSADLAPGKATWAHKALVVVDKSEALIGGTEPGADNHAVWTTNPSLVDVSTNTIILDITLLAREAGADPSATVAPMISATL